MCCGPLTPEAWRQASLSTSAGGLGLRHASRHSPAAYVASVSATRDLCSALDANYQVTNPTLDLTLDLFNPQAVLVADRVSTPLPPSLRQQQLSQALDRAEVARLSAPGAGREAYRAHLQLPQQPGAGAWLQAPPAEALGLHVDAALFRIMVRLRLRQPVAEADTPCPLCDGTADRFGDHARCCPCGGDRTRCLAGNVIVS